MKLITITVPTHGNITPYEIHRAIANREEYLKGMTSQIPKIVEPRSKVKKITLNAGIYNFITGCLP